MYINPNLFEEDWDALGTWEDLDTNDGVSEIDPAGQLHLDCISVSADGSARRKLDFGAIGDGDYYVEVKFKADTWDGYGTSLDRGIRVQAGGATNYISAFFQNGANDGDGIIIYDGAAFNLVYEHTWDNDWHTVVFFVHNSQTDVDIWVDKSPSEAADVTDADCSWALIRDGQVDSAGYGTVAGNGEYHIDYMYIGTELLSAGPTNLKSVNGVALADIKSINSVAIADVKSVNGIT